jgi:hypothetical protein
MRWYCWGAVPTFLLFSFANSIFFRIFAIQTDKNILTIKKIEDYEES